MNQQFEDFRRLQDAQRNANNRMAALNAVGEGLEKAIELKIDSFDLRHPEILAKILELHVLLMWEKYPALEPQKQVDEESKESDTPTESP